MFMLAHLDPTLGHLTSQSLPLKFMNFHVHGTVVIMRLIMLNYFLMNNQKKFSSFFYLKRDFSQK